MACSTVQVKNLDPEVDLCMLCDVMKRCGKIIKAEIAFDECKVSLGVGYVVYDNFTSACDAVKILNGHQCDIAKPLVVTLSKREQNISQFTNLYVRGFDKSWDDIDLEQAFKKFGDIQNAEVAVDEKGISKGFGFINFTNHASADSAVKVMHGEEVCGNILYVQPHIKKKIREKCVSEDVTEVTVGDSTTNLKISNLPIQWSDKQLHKLFADYGEIRSVKVPINEGGVSKGYGFINFAKSQSAERALNEMNGYLLQSKYLKVSFHQNLKKIENKIDFPCSMKKEINHRYSSDNLYNPKISQKGLLGARPKELFSFKGHRKGR